MVLFGLLIVKRRSRDFIPNFLKYIHCDYRVDTWIGFLLCRKFNDPVLAIRVPPAFEPQVANNEQNQI